MKPGNPQKAWSGVEKFLNNYQSKFSPIWWFGNLFVGREGVYVLLRMVLLLYALLTMFVVPVGWLSHLLVLTSSLALIDILLYNTSVAIVTRRPITTLRSIVLTFLSYLSIGLSFAIFYAGLRNDFGPQPLSSAWNALYFSLVTMTTLGYGDIAPLSNRHAAQIIVMLELGVSAYFLVIIVGRVIVWHGELRK